MRHIAGAPEPPQTLYDADVLILALDRPSETIAAIESALAQRGVRLHVTVLDQGSHPANLEAFAACVAARPDVTLVALGENVGVAAGRNRAAEIGHGRIIVGLDNDAVFDSPDTLAAAVAALDGDPSLAAVGFRIVVDATGQDDLLSWGYPRQLLPRAADTFDAATFVGAGHAIRRAAWEESHGYDEALFFCWEEFDFYNMARSPRERPVSGRLSTHMTPTCDHTGAGLNGCALGDERNHECSRRGIAGAPGATLSSHLCPRAHHLAIRLGRVAVRMTYLLRNAGQ